MIKSVIKSSKVQHSSTMQLIKISFTSKNVIQTTLKQQLSFRSYKEGRLEIFHEIILLS